MLLYAFSYALGRMTYCTDSVQRAIRNAWPELSETDRMMINRDINNARDRNRLGMDMDAKGWLALLDLPIYDSSTTD